jgi:hypothetical protein
MPRTTRCPSAGASTARSGTSRTTDGTSSPPNIGRDGSGPDYIDSVGMDEAHWLRGLAELLTVWHTTPLEGGRENSP